MRRLVPLVSIIVFADSMLFGALVPLVPDYATDLGLSKFQAGLLLGAYGAGALAGGIPSGILTARVGPRRAVLAGLLLLAATSGAFALASSAIPLGLARFGQGAASALTWAGALAWVTVATDRQRRGQLLGTVFGFAILGYIVGPMVGAVAELTSPRAAFGTVAAATLVLAGIAATMPSSPAEPRVSGAVRRALSDSRFIGGLWLNLLPAFFFGVVEILAPLSLADAGWGAVAIAAVFVCSGLLEVAVSPLLGRTSDRRGRLYPVRIALFGSIGAAIALSLASRPLAIVPLVFVGALTFSGFTTPGMALVSDSAERVGLPQGLGFGVMNTAWATGAMSGPALGGALGHAFSDSVPYVFCAMLCALTLVAVARVTRKPAIA
jgi:MFS family permease